ncbi:CynX/NimT family MFS transporter [Embleya scabrispora]|uniref:MFS transporter n=1 Tax=Embleya scabrispora TaxID=159449 RepID=UPI00099F05C2|nr:MFS transporter [Embleya scabrispora]MYS79472.1 MFS transporter [Streptomyces sp. SID5474]
MPSARARMRRDPVVAESAPGRRTGRAPGAVLTLVALFLIAINLRGAITDVPPLLTSIRDDLGLSGAAAGVLTAIPVVSMGVFAPLAHRGAARYGYERTVAASVVVLLVGVLIRLGGASVVLLFLGTLVAGAGIAVLGAALPGVVKTHFAEHAGAVTGLYSAAVGVGAAGASALAVPLSDGFGSWQLSLGVVAVPAVLGLLAWLPVIRRAKPVRTDPSRTRSTGPSRAGTTDATAARPTPPTPAPAAAAPDTSPWRRPVAWILAVFLVMQTSAYYGVVGWVPAAYEEQGWSAERAGLLLSVFGLTGIVSGLVIPLLADRFTDPRPLFAVTVAGAVVGMGLLAFAPNLAPWPTIALLGLTLGGAFPLMLVMLVRFAPSPAAAGRLSAMTFLIGYPIAAVLQIVFGTIHDATGEYTAVFGVLFAMTLVELAVCLGLNPKHARHS